MSDQSIVRLHVQVTVNPEDWTRFKSMLAEVAKIVEEEGPENVLIHQTYQQEGHLNCLIIEAYKNEQVFLNHLEKIKLVQEQFKVNWKVNRIELSGAYSQETVGLLRAGDHEKEFFFYGIPMG